MEETTPYGESKSLQRIVDGRHTAAVVFGSASEAVSANTRETESIRKGSATSPHDDVTLLPQHRTDCREQEIGTNNNTGNQSYADATLVQQISNGNPVRKMDDNHENDGFIGVERRRRNMQQQLSAHGKPMTERVKTSTFGDRGPREGLLKGAERVRTKPFHLAGISPDCSATDVTAYCRQRNVLGTGCYLIRTGIGGTQSPNIFVNQSSIDTILKENFWPDLVRCRGWERDPPRGPKLVSLGEPST